MRVCPAFGARLQTPAALHSLRGADADVHSQTMLQSFRKVPALFEGPCLKVPADPERLICAGPFKGKKRMFSWNAPKTYYKELTTPRLERSLDDRLDSKLFRTDAPGVVRAQHICQPGYRHRSLLWWWW